MTTIGPAGIEQLTMRQLIERYGSDLKRISEEKDDPTTRTERALLIARARRNMLMYHGNHFIAPGFSSDQFGHETIDWVDVEREQEGAQERFAYALNIMAADTRLFQSIMGQASPTVKAVANNVDSQEQIEKAKTVGLNLIELRNLWKLDEQMGDVSFAQFLAGPVFLYTPFVVDERKYGVTEIPNPQMVPGLDPMTGLPTEVLSMGEPERVPRGDVELNIYDIRHVNVPFRRKSIGSCEWLELDTLESKWSLLKSYREEMQLSADDDFGGEGDGNVGSKEALEAQIATAYPSGSSSAKSASQWHVKREWWDPLMFEALRDKQTRELFKKRFTNGVKITWINDKIVDMEAEHHTDVWACIKSGMGEFIMSNARVHDSIPFQRAFNDMMGLVLEIVLRSVPKVLIDQALVDIETYATHEAVPYEAIFTMAPNAGDISRGMAAFPMARMPDHIVAVIDKFREAWTTVSGIRPELGGGGAPSKTYREAKQRRDQAMMSLATPGMLQRAGIAEAYSNATKQRSKFGFGRDVKSESAAVLNLEEIPLDGWHVEPEEGIPMSFAERADKLQMYFMESSPEIVAAQGLLEIQNIKKVNALLQMEDFESFREMAFDQEMDIIGQLLEQAPVPVQSLDPMTGQPMMTLQTSIPLDPVLDDPAMVQEIGRWWFVSKAAIAAKTSKPDGYANVRARLEMAQQQIQAAQMAQAAAAAASVADSGAAGKPSAKPTEAPPLPPAGPVDQQALAAAPVQ